MAEPVAAAEEIKSQREVTHDSTDPLSSQRGRVKSSEWQSSSRDAVTNVKDPVSSVQTGGYETAAVPSPWIGTCADSPETKKQRVQGWRAGQGLKDSDVKDLIRKDSMVKADYQKLQKEVTKSKKIIKDADPLKGLPATWQAFYNTVPHLDAQSAYKVWRKEQQRLERAQQVKELLGEEPAQGENDDKNMELEVDRLEAEVQRKHVLLEERTKAATELTAKLAKVRRQDREEEARSTKLLRRLEEATYANGVARGILRSSEQSFQFAYQDSVERAKTEQITLTRAVVLTESTIQSTKDELKQMIKSYQEQQGSTTALASSNAEGGSHREGSERGAA